MLDDYKVSRKVGKALTLPTAPAYSLGGRHERVPVDPGPGPGQYGTGWSLSKKGTGFGTAPRSDHAGNPTPAGASYKPTVSQVMRSQPAYSFGGKGKKDLSNQTPGPGAYEPTPSGKLVKPSPSAFTIAPRTAPEKPPEKSPGPAEYNPVFQPRDPHAASIKFRTSLTWPPEPSPGPGEYDTPKDTRRPYSEGKTFGASRGSGIPDNGVPGPGEYGAPPIEPHRPRRASWTIGRASRTTSLRGPPSPGPGQYDITENLIARDGGHSAASDHRSPPAFTFAGKTHPPPASQVPGPSDYGVPGDPGRVSKPVFTLHGTPPKDRREGVPGPGAYAPSRADPVVKTSAPVISMGLKAYQPPCHDVKPGPGAYSPRDADGRISVSLKFRNEMHPDHYSNPAPHDYANKDFREFGTAYCGEPAGGRKGFTMRPRWPEEKRERVPGPHYAIGCSTLGVGAQPEMERSKMSMAVVL